MLAGKRFPLDATKLKFSLFFPLESNLTLDFRFVFLFFSDCISNGSRVEGGEGREEEKKPEEKRVLA